MENTIHSCRKHRTTQTEECGERKKAKKMCVWTCTMNHIGQLEQMWMRTESERESKKKKSSCRLGDIAYVSVQTTSSGKKGYIDASLHPTEIFGFSYKWSVLATGLILKLTSMPLESIFIRRDRWNKVCVFVTNLKINKESLASLGFIRIAPIYCILNHKVYYKCKYGI